jgi:hypothetical protein
MRRELLDELDVRDNPRYLNEVDRTVTENAIRDVDIVALRVAGLGPWLHARQFDRSRPHPPTRPPQLRDPQNAEPPDPHDNARRAGVRRGTGHNPPQITPPVLDTPASINEPVGAERTQELPSPAASSRPDGGPTAYLPWSGHSTASVRRTGRLATTIACDPADPGLTRPPPPLRRPRRFQDQTRSHPGRHHEQQGYRASHQPFPQTRSGQSPSRIRSDIPSR